MPAAAQQYLNEPPPDVAAASAPGSGWTAFKGGIQQTIGNALTNVGNWTEQDWIKALAQNPNIALDPATQAAMKAHPWWTMGGNALGGTALMAPATMAASAALPEVAGAIGLTRAGTALMPWLLGGTRAARFLAPAAKAALSGATAGGTEGAVVGDPNQSLESRIGSGAIAGGLTGGALGTGSATFGGGITIPANVARQARALGFLPGWTEAKIANWVRNKMAMPSTPAQPAGIVGTAAKIGLGGLGAGLGFGSGEEIIRHALALGIDPSALLQYATNPKVVMGALGAGGAAAATAAGSAYRNSDRFLMGLIARGGQAGQNLQFPAVAGAAAGGTAAQ